MKTFFTILCWFPLFLCGQEGPFAPSVGEEGSTAVPLDDERILGWADTVELYAPAAGAPVASQFSDPTQALFAAEGNVFQIVSLGRGELVVSFQESFQNGEGPELAVFENSFNDTFLELAFVEVSSDGVHFVRFPNQSLTPNESSAIMATQIDGLAGKYRVGFGTPFDFQNLPDSPLLDLKAVRFVRLVDIVGGEAIDSLGRTIFDAFLAGVSTGFDCDGIAALETKEFSIPINSFVAEDGGFRLTWESRVGADYCVEMTSELGAEDWEVIAEVEAQQSIASVLVAVAAERLFVRVRRK